MAVIDHLLTKPPPLALTPPTWHLLARQPRRSQRIMFQWKPLPTQYMVKVIGTWNCYYT